MLSVPAAERERYYSVMLCDGNTYNFGCIGTRATGCEPGDYMVAGPDCKGATPPGIKKVFRSTTQFAVAGCGRSPQEFALLWQTAPPRIPILPAAP